MIESTMQERPLACIVARPGTAPTAEQLRAHLAARVARRWFPQHWAFLDVIPKTSVGKLDRKLLRARQGEGALDQEGGRP